MIELPTTNIGKLPEELKTLKDLIERADKGNGYVTTIGIKKMLKAEAIKIFKRSLNFEDFGKNMFKFFEIGEKLEK